MKGLNNVYDVLKQEEQFLDNDGNMFKNKVCEYARKMDKSLIKLLYNNELTRDLFFIEIDDLKVFDSQRFNNYIENKDFLPDSYTSFKNSIGLFDKSGNSIKYCEDVVLQFPYKDCVLEFDSTKESDKRNEIFFNEILMKKEIDVLLDPKVLTNAKRYDENGVSDITEIDDKDNLIIKGNNLLALHSLLPRYKGKIKCMYWDILYNTDNDKVPYNDSFKHSSWLTMMKNRLEIAKELLDYNGVICLQCDDNEMAYLKVLCDEIFNRENFVSTIVIESGEIYGTKASHINKTIVKVKDYTLVYSKNKYDLKLTPLYSKMNELYDSHYNIIINEELEKISFIEYLKSIKWITELFDSYKLKLKIDNVSRMMKLDERFKGFINNEIANMLYQDQPLTEIIPNELISKYEYGKIYKYKDLLIFKTKNNTIRYYKSFRDSVHRTSDYKPEICRATARGDLWKGYHYDMRNIDDEGNVKLKNGKKPERLLRDILNVFTKPGDIILDAYLGSGTTAAVAHKMNRQYIGIEQLDSHVDKSLQRMQNVINGDQTGVSQDVNWQEGGSFVYCELKKLAHLFIDKVNKASEEELISIYEELKNNQFVSYRVDINKVEKNKKGFLALSEDKKRKLLIDVIDKNMLYVNYSDIEDEAYNVSQNDKLFNDSFYK
ncbi:site-specific DNA-methyltransferase [Romboutsia sp. MSSM.1001216sp_RTP31141st1_G3_RTP31141_220114]|uniref:site-specific DNA-methyltransferase n=1 Tax=unclassified Romboutsia TaxID=2626894 RepID=UPI0031B5D14D